MLKIKRDMLKIKRQHDYKIVDLHFVMSPNYQLIVGPIHLPYYIYVSKTGQVNEISEGMIIVT